MKVLIAHNDYGRHSGEEAVVDQMEKMLERNGHQVCSYRPSTAQYQSGLDNKVRVFMSGIYSHQGVQNMKKLILAERPDLINIHNLYPFISPAALFVCKAAGIPVVMTVHNYRLICPTGLFLRDGQPCEHCLHQGHEWGCIRFNCAQDTLKSMAYALRGTVARKMGAYMKNVDRYVCLTSFQKAKLVAAGYESDKIRVIPNSVPAPKAAYSFSGDYVAYVGRLSEEKGWDMLLWVATRNPWIRFAVAGEISGTMNMPIPDNIEFKGFLDAQRLERFYRGAKFLVIPSRCYEGFPVVALEAMAMGKPVVAPDHGGFTEIIGEGSSAVGCLFRPNDMEDLESVVADLWESEDLLRAMGRRAMEKVRACYSAERVAGMWEEVFSEVKYKACI